MNTTYLETPIGRLKLTSDGKALTAIQFPCQQGGEDEVEQSDSVLQRTEQQLEEYFAGKRTVFDLPLGASGTEFQQAVWRTLQSIPYGSTSSYKNLAEAINKPKAVRAVGSANGANPLPIVVPCHRVIGSDGSLTGFAGGVETKKVLLELEGALPVEAQSGLFG